MFLVLSVAPLVSSPLAVALISRLLPPPVGVRIGKTLVFVVRSCFPSVGVGVGFVCTRETGRWILTRFDLRRLSIIVDVIVHRLCAQRYPDDAFKENEREKMR